MIRALLRKEWQQHWTALVILLVLVLIGLGLITVSQQTRAQSASSFDLARQFFILLPLVGAVLLGHRLVVGEYQSKTQLFLEGLPLSQGWMITVKYLLGLAVMFTILSAGFVAAILMAGPGEEFTGRHLSIVAVRAGGFTWFIYNFFFMMGFLGRYRAALYIALFISFFAVDSLTKFEMDRFGPFALLDSRFAYEDIVFPKEALLVTGSLAALFLAVAFALGLTREGSVAARLAERMSHREKIFVATWLIGFLFTVTLLDEKQPKEHFDLHDAMVEERDGIIVKVSSGYMDKEEVSQNLAQAVADELAGLKEYLGLPSLPPVFVTSRRDLDPTRFERGILTEAEGFLARANFNHVDFSRQEFLVWLVRELLVVQSRGRAKLESKRWVHDGFPLFWQGREQPLSPLTEEKPLALRAIYGLERGFSQEDLENWLLFRERVGEDIAAGVAWSGLKVLARAQGEERCRDFVRSILGVEVPKDIRAVFHERRTHPAQLLENHAGLGFDEFAERWMKELAACRAELAEELAQIPVLSGSVKFEPLSSETRGLRYRVQINPPPPESARYAFLYHELPPLESEVDLQVVKAETNLYAESPEEELAESFVRGKRLYWTFSLQVPALRGHVISGWNRQEIP